MICKDGLVGAAGQTAPTKGYEPPLKIVCAVVGTGRHMLMGWMRSTSKGGRQRLAAAIIDDVHDF